MIAEGGSSIGTTKLTNQRGPYRSISLEKSNNQRGSKFKICMDLCDGCLNQSSQASALASKMGMAIREMLGLADDWRKIPMTAKQAAWARVEARLDLSNITDDPLKFEKDIQHIGILHKCHKFEVKKYYHENLERARPTQHKDDEDLRKITMK